jgi:hypothetical protein
MTRRERLMATLAGLPVDRPAVSFYELNALDQDPGDSDPYNIYSHPSWKALLDLTREKTDRIVMRKLPFETPLPGEITSSEHIYENGSLHTTHRLKTGSHEFTCRTRRDLDIDTIWELDHWLKDVQDLQAWLSLPEAEVELDPDISPILEAEAQLGASGIVMIDLADPLCLAAEMFDMQTYMVLALTETKLFHQLLERFAQRLQQQVACIAKLLPGRLWRVYGPEYAAPPYMPPALFREFVVPYDTPLIEKIHAHGGYARIHSHGHLRDILDDIVATGCVGLDPLEPPPQGDVTLDYVRERYGDQLVLFGNIELVDLENLEPDQFTEKVRTALEQGTRGKGRGLVLMPSASPIGRELSPVTLRNYEIMVELAESF